jgi:drug/metabolite transporter (DMT)-like permease
MIVVPSIVLALLSIVCYATLPVISKKSLIGGVPPFAFIGTTMLMMSALSLAISFVMEKRIPLADVKPSDWTGLLLFTIVNLAAFSLFLIAIIKMPVAHYQIMGTIGPVISIVLAYIFLGETIDPKFFIGLALIGAGLFIALK